MKRMIFGVLALMATSLLLTGCPSPTDDPIAVSGVALNVTQSTLATGETIQLVATVSPSDAANKKVSWVSGDPEVATVGTDGLVIAKASGSTVVSAHTVDGDKTATCAITVQQYFFVNFDTGDGSAVAAQSVESGAKATWPADPTREGYTFEGWFADADRSVPWYFSVYVITGPTTIYAKWVGIAYTLRFDANGGTGSMDDVTVACGEAATLPANGFAAPSGYLFTGWSVYSSANPEYAPEDPFTMPAGGTTLYATWRPLFDYEEYGGNISIKGLSVFWSESETSLVIPSSIDGKPVTGIGENAFYDNKTLISLVIPDSVTNIGSGAFRDCVSLTSVDLGEGVNRIQNIAFNGCIKLSSIAIPQSVTLIYDNVFAGCKNLSAITVDANNTVYSSEDGILYNKDKTELNSCPPSKTGTFTMLNTVKYINNKAFYQCTGITSISWSSVLDEIGRNAFEGCTGLTSVTFPSSLTFIKYNAFMGCANLSSVTLNSGLQTIHEWAFINTALTTLAIPASVTTLQSQIISTLTAITVEAANSAFSSVDGVLYSKDQKTLLCYPIAKAGTSYTVLSSVKTLGEHAFTLSTLTTISLPEGLEKIWDNAITRCYNIESIILPSTVNWIGMNTFWSCSNLKTVRLDATTPPALPSGLSSYFSWTIAVPAASLETYRTTAIWSNYASKIISQ